MGAILLEQQNPAGVAHLEKAMQIDPSTKGQVSTLLSGFYFTHGNKALAGFMWLNGENAKHIDPLFEQLMQLRDLPDQSYLCHSTSDTAM